MEIDKLLLMLITAHMFGDYVFQNDFLAINKKNSNFILFIHSWIWTACIWTAFLYKIGRASCRERV